MVEEKKDFKAVKVMISGGQKDHTETLSRSMLYSGVNIFGELSRLYLESKDQFAAVALQHSHSTSSASGVVGNSADAGESSMSTLSQNVLQIFKRLQKRDAVTKVKAFHELEAYLNGLEQGSEELANLLTFFLYHFCRILMNERERKVREAAHLAFAAFIRKGKRKLGPHLKKIFPLWLCSFFDPAAEVAKLAQQNFDLAFPAANQGGVFKIAFKNFLHFADEQLCQSEESQMQDTNLERAAVQETFDRITSTVLLALAHSFKFLETWSVEEKQQFRNKLVEVLDLKINTDTLADEEEEIKQEEEAAAATIIDTTAAAAPDTTADETKAKKRGRGRRGLAGGQGKIKRQDNATSNKQNYMWAFLSDRYRGRVRAACLQFVSVFINTMPDETVKSQLSQFAPLVFNLVSEQNSLLQTSLWRDAIFNIGSKFPESWTFINIKKDFLPKLNKCLKEAGYGAPVVLYENFVKFVSINPLYRLETQANVARDGKLNKASFKERCNLLREAMQSLYAGLQNDESVAFHVEAVASFFETLTFILLKRVQPMLADESVKPEEKEFALNEIAKVISLPIADFVGEYAKYRSRQQNARNIRSTIPKYLTKMLVDLTTRDVDQALFVRVCDTISEALLRTKRNSGRIFASIFKELKKVTKVNLKNIIVENILAKMIITTASELTSEIPDANKQNVSDIVKKCALYRRLIYTMNKHEAEARDIVECHGSVERLILQTGHLLVKIQMKEKLALKMLSPDDLKQFMAIKTSLLDSTILMVNLGWTDAEPELELLLTQGIFVEKLANAILQKGTERLEEIVFRPHLSIQEAIVASGKNKIDYELYFDAVRENESIHNAIFEAMSGKMLLKDQIAHYAPMIAACIESQISGKPSPLTEDDVEILKSFVILVLQEEDIATMPHKVLCSYFSAAKGLLMVEGDEQNAEMRELLFEQLLSRRVGKLDEQASFNKIWDIFTDAVKNKPSFIEYCTARLSQAVADLIESDSNNLEGVASFQHLTSLIYRFVHLQSDKIGVLKRIMLNEINFGSLERNPLPLKMFRDLFLDGNVSLDVSTLIKEKNDAGEFRYAWLVATMLNFKYLVSLTSFLELKNQLLIFVESDVIPALIFGEKTLIVSLCDLIATRALTSHSHKLTLEYFVAKMVDPGEDFEADLKPVLRVDDFAEVFNRVCKSTVEQLLATEFGGNVDGQAVEILEKLLAQISYFICDEQLLHQLFSKVKANLTQWLASDANLQDVAQCGAQVGLYMSMASSLERATPAEIAEFQISLVNFLLASQERVAGSSSFKQELQKLAIQISGGLFSPETKDLIREKLQTTELMNTMVEMLMNISMQVDNQDDAQLLDCSTLIQLCGVVKKTLSWAGALTDTIVSVFVQAVKDRAMWFDRRVQQQATSMAGSLQQLEVEMLKEMGETLLVCVSYLNEEVLKAHIEDNLYYILGCRVEALQKASFVLLKFIYDNFIPPVTILVSEDEELRQLQADFNEEIKEDEEREHGEGYRGKSAIAFRNISHNLIEMIDNAPNVLGGPDNEAQDLSAAFIPSNELLEKLVFGEAQEGCMNNKVYGYLLAWNAMLMKIEQGRIKSQLSQAKQYQSVLASLTDYLEANSPIYEMLLVSLVPFLPIVKKNIVGRDVYHRELSQFQPEYCSLEEEQSSRCLTLHTLINFMKSFPSLARKFYDGCDKQILAVTKPYIKSVVSPAIMENEIKKIELAQAELGQQNQLTFMLYKQTKEIVATYDKNSEMSVKIGLKIPVEYPLKSVVVDLTDQLKLKSGQVRKWSLSIRNLIQSRNGDIISAILLWKSNIDNEMDGIEECHICYCVLHGTDRSLPTLPCRNCNNKFHVGCIRKWFNTSNKSNCPLCQTFFWQ